MKTITSEKRAQKAIGLGLLLILIIILVPFFIVFINSFKTPIEIARNILSFPKDFSLNNYIKAWDILDFSTVLVNTLILTIIGNLGLIVFGTMTGYWLARHKTKFNNFFLLLLLASMAIPFEAIMIPIMKVTNYFHLNGSLWGMGISYWGLGASTVVFLTYGAMKSIPYELEEAARIDGCNAFRVFWQVVFPMLKNITITFTIMNVFWIWNDYLMPILMLGRNRSLYNIQISMRSLFLEYYSMWDVALAALMISIIPILIFFLIAQKNIISGITTGAVKG